MRERGVQSRRVEPGKIEPARRPAPPSRGGGNFWQALAIIALVAATAGWTTVAVLALRPTTAPAAATDSTDPNAGADVTDAPPPHDVPALEAQLPSKVNGAALEADSSTGDTLFGGDPWSDAMSAWLTSVSKGPSDLQYAEAADAASQLDLFVTVYRVPGISGTVLRDAIANAWKSGSTTTKVSQATIGGVEVTKVVLDESSTPTYLYVRGDLVYDVDTSDESIVSATIGALPGASGAPATSGSPAKSPAPAASPTK